MKVGVDIRMSSSSGIGRHTSAIISEWRKAGFEFKCFTNGGPIYSLREQCDYSRLSLDCEIYWVPHYNISFFSSVNTVATVHDVIHVALPGVFTSWTQRMYARLMLTAAAFKSGHVFFDSHFTKSEFLEKIGFLPRSSSIVHCGVDQSYWSHLGPRLPAKPPYFLTVGNLKPHKNFNGVLGAFEQILRKHPCVKLKIVGRLDGFRYGDGSFLKKALTNSSVEILGEVSDENLRKLYAEAVAFVLPSFYEGFGLPPLEAMAAGCPSVVSSTGALVEICGGGLGEFCDPYNLNSIAKGMEKYLLLTQEDRDVWRKLAKVRVEMFSWTRSAAAMWATFIGLSGRRVI